MKSLKVQLESLPSVAGIVQSAMVLNDALIKDWTFEGFTDVMGPKVQGHCNNLASGDLNLFPKSNFLLFSECPVENVFKTIKLSDAIKVAPVQIWFAFLNIYVALVKYMRRL